MVCVLQLFGRAGSQLTKGTVTEALDKRAMLALFRGERENSFRAAGRRMAGGSSSEFQVVESRGVIRFAKAQI